MKKIYIAGPMRGHKFYNFPAFDAAEARLRRLGYEVVNPASLDRERGINPETFPEDWDWIKTPEGFDFKSVALECLRQVSGCDGVFILKGWGSSAGACCEVEFARWLSIECLNEEFEDYYIVHYFGSPT